jgi:hypothetical protein
MIISTIKSFAPSPGHFFQVKDNEVVEDFTGFICTATDVEEVADEDHCCAGTGFGEGAAGVELGPGVGSGVEGVDVVGVGSSIGFAAVDYYDVASPEGRTVAAAFCWRRGGVW